MVLIKRIQLNEHGSSIRGRGHLHGLDFDMGQEGLEGMKDLY